MTMRARIVSVVNPVGVTTQVTTVTITYTETIGNVDVWSATETWAQPDLNFWAVQMNLPYDGSVAWFTSLMNKRIAEHKLTPGYQEYITGPYPNTSVSTLTVTG